VAFLPPKKNIFELFLMLASLCLLLATGKAEQKT
jgi:hypothetical protein